MTDELAHRIKRTIKKVIKYGTAEYEVEKAKEPPKPKPAPKPREPPKPRPRRDIDEVYAIPKRNFIMPTVNLEMPSLDNLMEMSLDELEDLDTAGPSGEPFDFKDILNGMRNIAAKVEIRDDDFDFATYQERLSRPAQITSPDDYCEVSIPTEITSLPLYKIIMNEDVDKYFNYIAMRLESNCRNPECIGRCVDADFSSTWMKGHFNPLHLAAANNKPDFIRHVALNYLHRLPQASPNLSEDRLAHYDTIVDNWLKAPTTFERACPVVVAAELDHVNCISYLMGGRNTQEKVASYNVGRRCYASYLEPTREPFLSKLCFHNRLDSIKQNELEYLLKRCDLRDMRLMFGDALSNGSFKSAKKLLAFAKAEDLLGIRQPPNPVGRYNHRGFIPVSRMRPVQLALYHGHSNVFDEIPICAEFKYDQYGYTPLLMCAVSLDDKTLRSTIERYRSWADREDLFVLLYQLIVANRQKFVLIELEYLLNTYKYRPRPGLDREYGLPAHVVLPMSGALTANKDMSFIEGIREIYMRYNFHDTGKLIDEDVIRCYEYIQYFNFKFSQQVRLAVILMLVPLTPVQNNRWLEIMHRHRNDRIEGGVSNYVLKSFTSPGVCERYSIFSWEAALAEAGSIVDFWHGTKEVSAEIRSLAQAEIAVVHIKQEIDENSVPNNYVPEIRGILRKVPRKFDY